METPFGLHFTVQRPLKEFESNVRGLERPVKVPNGSHFLKIGNLSQTLCVFGYNACVIQESL